MKLYFVAEKEKHLVGEVNTPEELAALLDKDSRKRFIFLKGKIDFDFAPDSVFTISRGEGNNLAYRIEN